jgi:hypothetical protein
MAALEEIEGRVVDEAHSTKSLCQVSASSTSSLSLGHDVKGGLHTGLKASTQRRSQ